MAHLASGNTRLLCMSLDAKSSPLDQCVRAQRAHRGDRRALIGSLGPIGPQFGHRFGFGPKFCVESRENGFVSLGSRIIASWLAQTERKSRLLSPNLPRKHTNNYICENMLLS